MKVNVPQRHRGKMMSDYYIYSRDDMAAARRHIAKLEEKNRRLVELLKTSVAEFDDGIKYPLEVVNDLKQVLASMEKDDD